MTTVQINRDAFARSTLMRTSELGGGICRYCGQPAHYYYGWLHDATRTTIDWTGPFCSVGCYRIYID